MTGLLRAGRITRLHKHIRILLLLTVVVRGGMFLGYPLQQDVGSNQGAQRYLIDRLLEGDLLIGNLRHGTGYPLAIAPVAAVGRLFGGPGERLVLLVQVSLSALIPFLLYDLVRRRHSRPAALAVALPALLDPQGLQWAHLSLPVWLVALCFTLSLWLMDRALQGGMPRGPLLVAGAVSGLAVLARLTVAPAVALCAIPLLLANAFPLRRRVAAILAAGAGCLLVLLGYMLLIHYPSTGAFRPSCVGAFNLHESIQEAGVPVVAENGQASARLLALNALPPLPSLEQSRRDIEFEWRQPGPWVSPQEQRAFLEQEPPQEAPQVFDIFASYTLRWYLGPCAKDSLLYAAALEALVARPLQFLAALPEEVLYLLHRIDVLHSGRIVTLWRLPHIDSLEIREDGDLPFPLQRARSRQGGAYRDHALWPAPVALFSRTRDALHLVNLLTVPALAWALWTRRPLFSQAAALLLFWLILLAVLDWGEGRIAAALWPLWPLLIGGMLADLWRRFTVRRGAAP